MPSPLVLIVEDEALIAIALTDDVEGAGYRVAGPFHRAGDTLAWLERHTPDVAIVDVHLRDGSSIALAGVLRERGVPFIVFSGDKREGRSPDAFDGACWLNKPVATSRLLDALAELAGPGLGGCGARTAAAAAPVCAC